MNPAAKKTILYVVLAVAAIIFIFPFYYMVVGAFQTNPTTSPSQLAPTSGWTIQNYVNINSRVDLWRTLANSGIFTAGVLLGTIIFGVLAGYAMARLHYRGNRTVFVMMLLVEMVPFQLLMIPLYVMIARNFGLGDTYIGVMLPFLINTTAVFIFRQFFLTIPNSLFDSARIDGASELRILTTIALPLIRPALVTALLVTFIGPWNEFLWPFLITKEASRQPLAVALANYISNVANSTSNPTGAILAGACVLAFPVAIIFIVFQRYFTSSDIGSAIKE